MENQVNEREENITLTEEEQAFVAEVISFYTNSTNISNDVETMKRMLVATDKKIRKNDKKIERLLNAIEYLDSSYRNGERLLIETALSFFAAAQGLDAEGFSAIEKGILSFCIFSGMELAFYGFKKGYNDKILRVLYKKLDDVAKQNGKLKGIYKDLDATSTYFDNMSEDNYAILK